MKKTVFFLLIVSVVTVNAQSISPEIISAVGDFYSNSTMMVSFTEGEPYGQLISNGTNLITEGFEQPDISTVSISEELTVSGKATIFPNPCNGTFKVQGLTNSKEIEVLNVLGEKIYKISMFTYLNQKEVVIHLTSTAGIYFVRMKEGENFHTEKLVIQ